MAGACGGNENIKQEIMSDKIIIIGHGEAGRTVMQELQKAGITGNIIITPDEAKDAAKSPKPLDFKIAESAPLSEIEQTTLNETSKKSLKTTPTLPGREIISEQEKISDDELKKWKQDFGEWLSTNMGLDKSRIFHIVKHVEMYYPKLK